jgi:hypothetical protein
MSDLLDDVRALDSGIADRVRQRTGARPARKLDSGDIVFIIAPLPKQTGPWITEKQGKAIALLVRELGIEAGALKKLEAFVNLAQDKLQFEAVPLVGDKLDPVNRILHDAPRMSFTSPTTLTTYRLIDYLAIAKLMKESAIYVFQCAVGGLEKLSNLDGTYFADKDIMLLYNPLDGPFARRDVIHESTHAIQDWRDLKMLVHYAEADAYIAGAATLASIDSAGKLAETAFAASRFALNDTARNDNPAWRTAYDKVVKAYDATNDDGSRWNRVVEPSGAETARYQNVLSGLESSARATADFVGGLAKGARDTVVDAVKSSLP